MRAGSTLWRPVSDQPWVFAEPLLVRHGLALSPGLYFVEVGGPDDGAGRISGGGVVCVGFGR